MGQRRDSGGESRPAAGNSPPHAFQPRFVLLLLLAGAFAGIWVTHRSQSIAARLISWTVVVATGALAGGTYWKLLLFNASAFDRSATRQWVRSRWRRLETVLVWTATVAGFAYLYRGIGAPTADFGSLVLGIGALVTVASWASLNGLSATGVEGKTNRWRGGIFAGSVVSITGFALLETGLANPAWVVRLGHVSAVALWVGGAVWHNFVVLPTVRRYPEAAPAMKSQARGFRRHLPIVIVVLLGTGTYQTVSLAGYSVTFLVEAPIGHVVSFKLLVLTTLTALVATNLKRQR